MLMTRRSVVAALAAVLAAPPASAQTVIHTAKSTIEIIGLKRWTTKMIEDSLAKYAEDDLSVHACAAVLRFKLHFADASVVNYVNFPEFKFKDYLAITVIEPGDSSLIRYKPRFRDSLPVRAEWAEAVRAIDSNFVLSRQALRAPSFRAKRLSAEDSVKFAKVEPLRRVLIGNRNDAALDFAIHMLDNDANAANREIAILILANFADRDVAWRALADAQRDPAGRVPSVATEMLQQMLVAPPQRVDWEPVADRLRYILDGTNLFALSTTMDMLVKTNVDPRLAPRLLAGGGTLFRSIFASGNVIAKREISAFLSKLSGLSETSDPATFERWMDGLNAPASR
jgi:hypothetical protein